MKHIYMIPILACLAIACVPTEGTRSGVSVQPVAEVQATAEATAKTGMVSLEAEPDPALQEVWPGGEELQRTAEGFMDSGFMCNPARLGFADLAYHDIALDFLVDDQGRISQINGVSSGLYDSYSFTIPVVQRRVDAISGSRQVNQEDVIIQLGDGHWRILPVSLKDAPPFEVRIASSIELASPGSLVRITRNGSIFTCTEVLVKADGQEDQLVSWKTRQYEIGVVHEIQSAVTCRAGVPVILAWEPGSIAGYIASLPGGEAAFAQRLRWEPAGELETDRYNFLVLLTQRHGEGLDMKERLGAVDPVWLALLMYDYVVNP